ncbi:NAD(P)/FAD-dependent oxidoreductase [Plastorhodobacter daqingensis]|uniref:NAD(P)/FAD-dependent oxidoreductase n=1 Tax=Plastorhodobacter daqingensis TaxID=1387281 RepID=A0ABW2UMQ3_9RHOB
MIVNEIAPIANSLWSATANATPPCPPLRGEEETDVAIVGAGFTGLSAALHLAEAGVAATVLEAETPGWGASGRNGGQVNPGLKEDPDAIEARFGPDIGARMVTLAGGAGDLVFSLIRRHGIDCAGVQAGWIQPVHDAAALRVVQARVDQWARRGAPLRMLSRQETAEMLGTDAYIGGMIDPRGGNLHPLNYALGLAEAALAAGAVLHGQSRALRLERTGAGFVLHTAEGRLRARRVLLCTNGYTDDLMPPLRRTVVPVRSVQVATAPLSDNMRRSILPGGHSASDSRRLLLYFRLDPEGRFVMGGRGAYDARGTLRQMQALREVSEELYPQLNGVEWSYAWGGYVAMTADHYPHLHRMAPGVMAGLGYNGRGVAMATAMGKVLADWARGVPEEALDFPVTEPRPIPLHFLRKPAVRATVAWYRLRDRLAAPR